MKFKTDFYHDHDQIFFQTSKVLNRSEFKYCRYICKMKMQFCPNDCDIATGNSLH